MRKSLGRERGDEAESEAAAWTCWPRSGRPRSPAIMFVLWALLFILFSAFPSAGPRPPPSASRGKSRREPLPHGLGTDWPVRRCGGAAADSLSDNA